MPLKRRGLSQLRARSACVRWLAAMLLETPTHPLLGTKIKNYRTHTLPMRVSRFENQEDYSSCAPSFFNIRRLRSLARSHAARNPNSPAPRHQNKKQSNPHFANAGFALRKPRGLFQLRALFFKHQALAFVGSQPCCSKPQLTLSWAPNSATTARRPLPSHRSCL